MKTADKKKKPVFLPLLVFAAIASSLFTSGTLAKYISSFSGKATAQVAAFTGGGQIQSFSTELSNMVPGGSRAVTFTVRNYDDDDGHITRSDVQMDYIIEVTTTGNLPLEFSLGSSTNVGNAANNKLVTLGRLTENDGVYTASGGILPLCTEGALTTHDYQLSVTWRKGEEDVYSEEYSHEIDLITINVITVQSNPNSGAGTG